MLGSQKANFGRSKEKRSDCRLIRLNITLDNQGFVRYSQLYPSNISESFILDEMLKEVEGKLNFYEERPIMVVDAGISTEQNLESIKGKKSMIMSA